MLLQMTIQYPYPVHTAALSNCDIAYIDEGSGPKTLLFLHGLAGYALSWKKNIDVLKKQYRCIAIDLPGNGLSDRKERKYSMHFFSKAVYELIQQLGLKDLCIVGHSMGGQIALNTIINHPDCANSLVLCAPAGFEQFSPFERTMYHTSLQIADMFATEEHSLRQVTESSFYRNPTQANELVNDLITIMHNHPMKEYRKMVEACIMSMVNEPVFDKLPQILQPALVLFGEYDALIPNKLLHHTTTKKIAETGVNRMPGAILKMIPDCGHFVQWEKAAIVNESIVSFLSSVPV